MLRQTIFKFEIFDIDEYESWIPKCQIQCKREHLLIQRHKYEWIMYVTVSILGRFSNLINIKEEWTFTQYIDEKHMKLRIKQKAEFIRFGKLMPNKIATLLLNSNANGIRYWLNMIHDQSVNVHKSDWH